MNPDSNQERAAESNVEQQQQQNTGGAIGEDTKVGPANDQQQDQSKGTGGEQQT